MATKQQREERTRVLLKLLGLAPEKSQYEVSTDLDKLHRWEATLHRISENECNGHPKTVIELRKNPDGTISTYRYDVENVEWASRDAKKEKSIQEKVTALLKPYNIDVQFNGDPRGGAIRMLLPDHSSNGWDGETWGIYW